MAETIVENQICSACGVDIRKGALFCYHCGEAVAPEIAAPQAVNVDEQRQLSAKDNKIGNGKNNRPAKLKKETEKKPELIKEIDKKPIPKPEVQPEKNLKSAAALRKKSKAVQNKKIEIIWEEHDNPPNFWFVLTALLLTAFAVGIMWTALYFG